MKTGGGWSTPSKISFLKDLGGHGLSKIAQAGVRRRAELLYQQLDGLQALRRTLRPEFLAGSRKHKAAKLLRQIPCIGPIRAARLIALMQTPHRFRSERLLWTYSGLGD
jgi:transposase